ncbi:MAG: 50S ribosomal protein L21e [archaeon]|nr:MAG: 50S ribosomal protein L21e [archaeon]
MLARKRVKDKGKKRLSKYFKEYKPGDRVALVIDLSEQKGRFFKRFQGMTGTIEKKQGNAYVVKFLNGRVIKRVITTSPHLKAIK